VLPLHCRCHASFKVSPGFLRDRLYKLSCSGAFAAVDIIGINQEKKLVNVSKLAVQTVSATVIPFPNICRFDGVFPEGL
jgi:hypothetical protein